MARTHIEDALLREPNLWVHGKKPIGQVKIDLEHRLSKGCVAFYLCNSFFNLITNGSGTVIGAVHIDPPRGMVFDGNFDWYNADLATRTNFAFGTGDYSILIKAYKSPTQLAATPSFISNGAVGAGEWMLRVSGSTDLNFYADVGAISVTDSVVSFPNDSIGYAAVTRVGNKVTLYNYKDGIYHNEASQTAAHDLDAVHSAAGLGQAANDNNRALTGTMYWAMVFKGVGLNRGQLDSLFSDPYQILMPA